MNRVKTTAQRLAQHGRGGDTLLAHINPREAALLKAAGGSGTINPKTGLLEFDDGGDGGGGLGGGGFGGGGFGGDSDGGGFGGFGGFGGYGGYGPGIGSGKVGMGTAAANAGLGGGPSAITGEGFASVGGMNRAQRTQDQMAAVNSVANSLYGQMNNPNADLSSLAKALGDARMGNVGALNSAGYTSEAKALDSAYSPRTTGLLSMVKSMFTDDQNKVVNTPQRSVADALSNGYLGMNTDGSLSVAPKSYASIFGLPLGIMAGSLLGPFGGLLGLGLGAMSSKTDSDNTGLVSAASKVGSTAAGMLGAPGLASALGAVSGLAGIGQYGINATNAARGIEAAGLGAPGNKDMGSDAGTGNGSRGPYDVEAILAEQNQRENGLMIDPMQWYRATHWKS